MESDVIVESDEQATIGCNNGHNNYLSGCVENLRIYDRELSDQEVLDIAELDYQFFYKNHGKEIKEVKGEASNIKN